MSSKTMDWIPYGPHAALIRFADRVGDEAFQRGRAMGSALEKHPPPGLVEFVPAFTTLLLEFDPHDAPDTEAAMRELMPVLERATQQPHRPPPVKEIPVTYDGPDLERVARMHDLTAGEVRERHAGTIYKVYMLGFAPGFPYLGDLDESLHTPRLASPRKKVKAGSVAIGGEHTGIYPMEGPGGWNIIGHTTVQLCGSACLAGNSPRDEAFYLKQGDRVRFVPRAGNS